MASVRVLQRRFASIFSRNRSLLLNSPGVRSIQQKTEQVANRCDYNESQNSEPALNNSNVNLAATSNLRTSSRHDLAMIFTCKVCETRSVKTMSRESYERGVVVAKCGGCGGLHLIADHLGWFGESGTVEDLLAARGEEVKRGSMDTLNLTLEDLVGTKPSRDDCHPRCPNEEVV